MHSWSCSLFLTGSEAELAANSGRSSRSGLLTADDLRVERTAASGAAAAAEAEAAVRAAAGGVYVHGMGVSAAANTSRVPTRRAAAVATRFGSFREGEADDLNTEWN